MHDNNVIIYNKNLLKNLSNIFIFYIICIRYKTKFINKINKILVFLMIQKLKINKIQGLKINESILDT